MKPVVFEGHNTVFAKGQPQYRSLPAFVDAEGKVIQCWELSEADIKTITETKQIWVMQMTFNEPLQPILLQPETFFSFPKNKTDGNTKQEKD